MQLTDRLARIRRDMGTVRLTTTNHPASPSELRNDGQILVHADDVQALADAMDEAVKLATAADALLDEVIDSPDIRVGSRHVSAAIGALNRACTAWQALTDPTWPKSAATLARAESDGEVQG